MLYLKAMLENRFYQAAANPLWTTEDRL